MRVRAFSARRRCRRDDPVRKNPSQAARKRRRLQQPRPAAAPACARKKGLFARAGRKFRPFCGPPPRPPARFRPNVCPRHPENRPPRPDQPAQGVPPRRPFAARARPATRPRLVAPRPGCARRPRLGPPPPGWLRAPGCAHCPAQPRLVPRRKPTPAVCFATLLWRSLCPQGGL